MNGLAQQAFSPRRVAAMVLRYWYLLRSSFARLIELIYWPTVQMLMWGFLQTYLAGQTSLYARAGGVLIGAVMLWDILFRGQLGFSISFLEEMWSRNLGNLMISPLRPAEFVIRPALATLPGLAREMGQRFEALHTSSRFIDTAAVGAEAPGQAVARKIFRQAGLMHACA